MVDLSAPGAPPVLVFDDTPFLDQVDRLIDWTAIASLMDVMSARAQAPLPVSAVRIALLKRWYGLTDGAAEQIILDRASFRAFLGYTGDGGSTDSEVLTELRDRVWTSTPDMAALTDEVETQLRVRGLLVQPGHCIEPSLRPATERGGQVQDETTLFRDGDLGRMVEAVTAKAHAQGQSPATGSHEPLARSASPLRADAGRATPSPAAETRRVHAVLCWPWGQTTELTEHLNIGREHPFSPLARELAPYTHVSRRHAELMVYGDGVWVRDLGSRNGTYVNNELVPKGQAFLIDCDSALRFGPLLTARIEIRE